MSVRQRLGMGEVGDIVRFSKSALVEQWKHASKLKPCSIWCSFCLIHNRHQSSVRALYVVTLPEGKRFNRRSPCSVWRHDQEKSKKVKEKSREDLTLKQSSDNIDVSCLSDFTTTNFMNVYKCFLAWMFTSEKKKKRKQQICSMLGDE